MESGIYIIKNTVNGKCYVGSTKNFKKRWQRHFRDLRKNVHSSILFQRAYNKYGEDAFVCEKIEEIPYEKNIIIERENYYIKKFNSKKNGYNIADASFGDSLTNNPNRDDIIRRITETVRKNINKMSYEERQEKWAKYGKENGNFRPEIHKKCPKCGCDIHIKQKTCNKCRDRTGENNPFFGKTHSEDVKMKISLANKGRKPLNMRKVEVDGLVFESVKACAKHFNVCNATVIFRIKSKHFNWNYVNA